MSHTVLSGAILHPPSNSDRICDRLCQALSLYNRLARNLPPSLSQSQAAFVKKYRAEMAQADAARVLDLLAALSHGADFSVGCYCEREDHCHRSVLRKLLQERGAAVVAAEDP